MIKKHKNIEENLVFMVFFFINFVSLLESSS